MFQDTKYLSLTMCILCTWILKKTLPRAIAIVSDFLIFSLHSSTAKCSKPVTTVASIVTNVGSVPLSSINDIKLMLPTNPCSQLHFIQIFYIFLSTFAHFCIKCCQLSGSYQRIGTKTFGDGDNVSCGPCTWASRGR